MDNMGNILFFVVIIVLIIAIPIFYSNNKREEKKKKINSLVASIPGFNPTKTIQNIELRYSVLIDDVSKKVCILEGDTFEIFDFDKIISVEYIEDGETITSKSTIRTIGGTLVGGVIAGGVGAIVGGLSGKSKTEKKISSINIKIMLRDINKPCIEILAFDRRWTVERAPVTRDNSLCKVHLDTAKEVVDVISVIIDAVDKDYNSNNTVEAPQTAKEVQNSATLYIADEIKKLANLRDEGVLTQEEFEKQKKSLLSLL